MYHSYFGLKEQVFSIAVDPHYLYMSSQHREALAHLLYGVSSGGFVLLTGEVGTGKTTIVRCLLEQLPRDTDLAIVLNPVASAPELLGNICDEFRIPYNRGESSIKALMDKLYEYLLANHTRGRNTVLLIDEAQLLRISTLEQIRLLTNLETNTRKLMQIILVGQPELNSLLAKPSLRQLSQRITARYHLRALTLQETHAYITHRLHVAGMKRSQQPFPDDVIRVIHETSRGIPRLINVLCDRMLLGAYSQDKTHIDQAVCQQACREVLGEEAPLGQARKNCRMSPRLRSLGWVAAAAVIAGAGWLLWPALGMAPQPVEAAKAESTPADMPRQATESAGEHRDYPTYSYSSQSDALLELFKVLDVTPITRTNPCDNGNATDYRCARAHLATWNELQALDRPVVLRLVTPAKQEQHAALVALHENAATVSYGGSLQRLPFAELGPLWTGDVTYVWRKPKDFHDPVGVGAEGPVVGWIAARFAELDGQREPLAKGRFTRALAERVKIFQRHHQLQDDGVFGERTLMVLNEQLGIDHTLQSLAAALMDRELVDSGTPEVPGEGPAVEQ